MLKALERTFAYLACYLDTAILPTLTLCWHLHTLPTLTSCYHLYTILTTFLSDRHLLCRQPLPALPSWHYHTDAWPFQHLPPPSFAHATPTRTGPCQAYFVCMILRQVSHMASTSRPYTIKCHSVIVRGEACLDCVHYSIFYNET